MYSGPSCLVYKSSCKVPKGLAGPIAAVSIPAGVLGGINKGDKHLLPTLGDKQVKLLFPNSDTKLFCDGLGVRKSLVSIEVAGDEQRASKLIARIGLGERLACKTQCSVGNVVLPSGANVRI